MGNLIKGKVVVESVGCMF